MASRQEPYYTPEEYLALEGATESKNEYYAGRIYAMTGASPNHNRITANLMRDLGTTLRGRRCEVFGGDMKVRVAATGLYTYPDVVAFCGSPQFDPQEQAILLNPSLIVEVLSPSTESYDRGTKFSHYRKIPSLQEYVLFTQNAVHAERFVRDGESWVLTNFDGPDAVMELPSVACTLRLAAVYERVELSPEPPLRAVHEPAASYAGASA